jgi:hypothetical protein
VQGGDGLWRWRGRMVPVNKCFRTHRASVAGIDFAAAPGQRPGRRLRHNSRATQSHEGSGRRWVISALREFQTPIFLSISVILNAFRIMLSARFVKVHNPRKPIPGPDPIHRVHRGPYPRMIPILRLMGSPPSHDALGRLAQRAARASPACCSISNAHPSALPCAGYASLIRNALRHNSMVARPMRMVQCSIS